MKQLVEEMSFEPGVEERRSNGWWQWWWRKWRTNVCEIGRVISLHDQQPGKFPIRNSRGRVLRDGTLWTSKGYDIRETSATIGLNKYSPNITEGWVVVRTLYVRERILQYMCCLILNQFKDFRAGLNILGPWRRHVRSRGTYFAL